mmetsp:Transcript_12821/g.1936  ORF Transcript_12821/g.1936 Transcript_12821/m.1936 type:complete len:88 (+) Transcript_12821:382-645(+)
MEYACLALQIAIHVRENLIDVLVVSAESLSITFNVNNALVTVKSALGRVIIVQNVLRGKLRSMGFVEYASLLVRTVLQILRLVVLAE